MRPQIRKRVLVQASQYRLRATEAAPSSARSLLARDLGDSFTVEEREVAQLLVSELVTNAVLHSHSDVILLDIGFHDDLRVAVTDASAQVPRPRPSTSNDRDGRGLLLVESLAKRWGIDRTSGNGKRVWFELSGARPRERRDVRS